ncbi:MAG: 2-amino-4-hydroxy-6-hydroxymethyldihydropteridine diphosphokinase [Microbacteriaceae bacterium]|nr:2-amino-4-hydroxy-6-hydroxymethyldihydropteridine diphosphokinase [Microbacteriaceae bacterium]
MPAVQAILALGGNLGNRKETIRSAIRALKAADGITVLAKSPLVESFALTEDCVDRARPSYLNGVVKVETTLKPGELLDLILGIERDHGRVRLERWGSRTLDIDIITYGTTIKDGKRLTLPHPRAFERAFVLVPWALMDPAAVLPGHGPVAALAEIFKNEVWLVK